VGQSPAKIFEKEEVLMKRFLVVLLALLMVTSTVFAQGGTEATTEKKVEEVYFLSSIGAYKTLLEKEIENWNETDGAAKGVKIIMETNIDNYGTALQGAITAGNYPDLADMYGHADMLKAGYARDLYTVPGIEDLIKRFEPYLSQGTNLHGDKLYSLPLEVVPLKMVYNKEIFKECGIAEPPTTLAEMVEDARIITEKGNGKYYGFGFTTMWSISFSRLCFKTFVSSTGKFYWDPNTATYDFSQYEPIVKAIAEMYQKGYMFPTPLDQHIDPIRSQFGAGLVGMEMAPAYDVSVYTNQFPCDFEWGVFDPPAFTEDGYETKGFYLNRGNVSITKWVSDERMAAVVEAFKFLHSEELYKKIYSNSGMIPHEIELINEVKAEGFDNLAVNWDTMSDIEHYQAEIAKPDNLLTLDGDNMQQVCTNIMLGETTWEAEIDGLNKRYNDAYQQAKKDGLIETNVYEAKYDYKEW